MGIDTLDWIVLIGLFVLAYVGLFFPNIPDIPLALAGFAYYQFFVDDRVFGWFFWFLMVSLTLIFMVIDYIAGGVAAKKFGGSKWSLVAAPVGAILLLWFPFGIIVGPLLLVFLIEYYLSRDWDRSLKIALTTMIGFLGGLFMKLVVMSLMILWFLLAVL